MRWREGVADAKRSHYAIVQQFVHCVKHRLPTASVAEKYNLVKIPNAVIKCLKSVNLGCAYAGGLLKYLLREIFGTYHGKRGKNGFIPRKREKCDDKKVQGGGKQRTMNHG